MDKVLCMSLTDQSTINHYSVGFRWFMLLPPYWLSWLAVALLSLLSFIPARGRLLLAKILTPIVRPFCLKPIKIAKANLSHCFPEYSDAQLRSLEKQLLQSFLLSGINLGALALNKACVLREQIKFDGLNHLQQVQAKNKPIIFLVPHVFALEFAAAGLAMMGLPMIGMIKHHRCPVFNWLACRQRLRFGGQLFHRQAGIAAVVRSLKSGNSLFYLPDQDHGPTKSVFAPFFSTEKATLPVLGRMAHCANAEVIPLTTGFCQKSGQVHIQLSAPLVLGKLNKKEEAQLLNEKMEQLIKPYIGQYMWFLKLLKTRPDGQDKIY